MSDDSTDDEIFAAFGEVPVENQLHVEGFAVGEGTSADTLQPCVILYVRIGLSTLGLDEPGDVTLGHPMSIDIARKLADELNRWADSAARNQLMN